MKKRDKRSENSMSHSKQDQQRQVLAVSELNRLAKRLLESHFDQVWVRGELSNLARPQSGHWYFSLKDSQAQIRCAMFRNRNSRLRFQPKEGDELIARGRISIYEGRGDYQLIVDNLQPAGAGALQQRLEELKLKLQQEGLFDAAAKRALPTHPQHVAIVSSASGAALQDVISVFERRAPQVLLSVLPVAVQGRESAVQLTAAVKALAEQSSELNTPVDAIIIARGGGSLEDLWSFNDESLARAIAACAIPVVSAVGHETDFSICDLVADVRAPTPSAAAELLSPDGSAMLTAVQQMAARLTRCARQTVNQNKREFVLLRQQLRHPGRRLEDHSQRCDELHERLLRSVNDELSRRNVALEQRRTQLLAHNPQHAITVAHTQLGASQRRLAPAIQSRLQQGHANLAHYARMLHTVSPLATLERGYAIVDIDRHGQREIVRDASSLSEGDRIDARLAQGRVSAKVLEVDTETALSETAN